MRRPALVLLALLALLLPASEAMAEQAGAKVPRYRSGLIDAGNIHTCAVMIDGKVRCWGVGADGRLGYGNEDTVGNDEEPRDYGPVNLGLVSLFPRVFHTARAIAAGYSHTCAILENGSVECWGYGAFGRLGYANTSSIGDDELPGNAGTIDLGPGRRAVAITAGGYHTCAILGDRTVRCWGSGTSGALGYGNESDIGDDETPAAAGPVNLGAGRTARAIAAGFVHTCALLDNWRVRCWGDGYRGVLGYGNTIDIGDNETPGSVGPVNLGAGRTARAISASESHTCAVLDNGRVRCWGMGNDGALGIGSENDIGDDETPGLISPVNLGAGRTARAIATGYFHTCALLDHGAVRCWGEGAFGELGYGNQADIGDDELPGSVGPVNLGLGRRALAVTTGTFYSCALLDDGTLRCWGLNTEGELGYGHIAAIGDDETPDQAGPVNLGAPIFTRGAPTLTLNVRPRRDATLPITFRAFGQLRPPLGPPLSESCRGNVRITVKRGATTIKRVKDALGIRNGRCVYSKSILITSGDSLGSATKLRVLARFLGNELLTARSAPARTIGIT